MSPQIAIILNIIIVIGLPAIALWAMVKGE